MQIRRERVIVLLVSTVYFLVVMNAPLITYGVKYGYLLMFLVLISFLLLGHLTLGSLKKYGLHFIYIVLMLMSLGISIIFLEGGTNSFISFGLYTLPLVVWVIFYSSNSRLSFSQIFTSTYILTVIVAYLGIIQFFFSPTLFGNIPTNSMAIKWAMDKPFAEYALFFRATSTLGSPQVFGLFCALNLLLTLRYKAFLSSQLFYIGLIGLALGGALSGNKSFFVIVALYIILTNVRNFFTNWKFITFIVFTLSISIFNYQRIVTYIPMLERVFSVVNILEQESAGSESRLGRYGYILLNTNPFIGEGLGKITNTSTDELKAAESYFLKIYYEAGVIAMLVFLVLCLLSYFQARKAYSVDSTIIALTILGMVVVHAFESPAFFIIWGHLLGAMVISLTPINIDRKYEK